MSSNGQPFNVDVDLLDVQVNSTPPLSIEVECVSSAVEIESPSPAQVVDEQTLIGDLFVRGPKGDEGPEGDAYTPVVDGTTLRFVSTQTGEEIAFVDLAGVIPEDSKTVEIDGVAGEAVILGQVIGLGPDGLFVLASIDILAHSSLVLGLATHGAMAGAPLNVIRSGVLVNPGWSFNIGSQLFLGLNGSVTQQLNQGDFMLQVGLALSPTSILVEILEPIVFE